MYCSKCAAERQLNGSSLHCPAGEMYLSPDMEKELTRLIEETVIPGVLSSREPCGLDVWM